MLFLLKRTVAGGLLGLLVLAAFGLCLRSLLGESVPPLRPTSHAFYTGLAILGAVLISDGVIHGALWLVCGEPYRRGYRELAGVFRGQTLPAVLTGALMAGIGEELVFRGLSESPWFLFPMGIAFGLLHHLQGPLRAFTFWFIWEGTIFAIAMFLTGELFATMTAHFLHDVLGFLAFRWTNERPR